MKIKKDVIFIRHKLGATNEDLEKLWNSNLIAIHFSNNGKNPDKYNDKTARNALKRMIKYGNKGVLVVADYSKLYPGRFKIGEIIKDTPIKLDYYSNDVREYKTIKMHHVKIKKFANYPLLKAIQPRGTITGWPSVKEYINAIYNSENLPFNVNSLHPSQLEVICYEYLKNNSNLKEIMIEFLLLPIGRTLFDIDIVGINNNGNKIYAQVTHKKINSDKFSNKIKKLANYKSKDTLLVFFGPDEIELKHRKELKEHSVIYIKINDVFNYLTSNKNSDSYKGISYMLNYQ